MIEPFMAGRAHDGRLRNDLSAAAVVRACAIAGGLGSTSAYTWLKLPVVEDMERVLAATTLPVLLLGGDPDVAPRRRHTPPGRRPWRWKAFTAWSWDGPCSIRRTATSPRRWTPPPPW